jgi:hypothetical protein
MSSFIVPVADPQSPAYQTFPDVIRGTTVEGFILRDRWIYSSSRRNLVSFPNFSTTAAGAVVAYSGYTKTSTPATGGLWIVGYGEKGTVSLQINGTAYTYTFPTTAAAWVQLVTPTYTLGSTIPYALVVTLTAGQPYVNLYGLAIYEEQLTSAQLP